MRNPETIAGSSGKWRETTPETDQAPISEMGHKRRSRQAHSGVRFTADSRHHNGLSAVRLGADTVEKVENSTSAKILLKSAQGEFRKEKPSRQS
ncbi:hypothetical protein Q2941_46420 [Bradyrhizobium sp. UFLA05-153]